MNLHQLVSGAIGVVNPPCAITILKSTGAFKNEHYKRIPEFKKITAQAQIQPLTDKELEHLNGLNSQGHYRAVYLLGNYQGVNRIDAAGGDLLQFEDKHWLIVQVMETWTGWCKVIVCLQST